MTDAERALLERQSLKPVISTEATTREELRSTQEEADARMLLHAFHAAEAG